MSIFSICSYSIQIKIMFGTWHNLLTTSLYNFLTMRLMKLNLKWRWTIKMHILLSNNNRLFLFSSVFLAQHNLGHMTPKHERWFWLTSNNSNPISCLLRSRRVKRWLQFWCNPSPQRGTIYWNTFWYFIFVHIIFHSRKYICSLVTMTVLWPHYLFFF
jgi:hypothetical protein